MFNPMGGGNMGNMMKKVQQMQKQMEQMQAELKKKTVEVSSGGGVIKLTMNGDKQITALHIDPTAVDPQDVEMLQDLICAAVNEAVKKTEAMMAEEMSKLTSSMGLPPGMF